MAYTIIKSDGNILTTIADGTINTTSTSIGLPGRNYAGYGQTLDTNFVWQLENFADTTPPPNPMRGQLWYNTNNSTLYVCPTDNEANGANWSALTSTSSGGTTTFGAVTVTGNLQANNINATNNSNANAIYCSYLTVSANANIANASLTGTTTVANLVTTSITSGSSSTTGVMTGVWTHTGSGTANGVNGTSMWVTAGNLVITGGSNIGIRTDYYYYANGSPISFAGTYANSNVAVYLPTYTGIVGNTDASATFRGSSITTGASGNAGSITGNWTLTSGSRLNATYADLAERFEADSYYDAGTVVELGGEKEITAVQYELSEDVFGVVSETAGYLMNAGAGNDNTHPPIAVGGRLQVKVTGKVRKGQRLVSAGNGIARAAKAGEATSFNVIGRALAHKTTDELGSVEAFVKIN